MCVRARVCDRKGELWALKSDGRGAPRCIERQLETRGLLCNFSFSFCLRIQNGQADFAVIKGKRSDGPEAFVRTFLKLISFVGAYVAMKPF